MPDNQPKLFEMETEWEKEWKDMPEFDQGDLQPIKEITVYFLTKEDIKKFCEITGITVTMKTMGVYFPKQEIDRMVFVDEQK